MERIPTKKIAYCFDNERPLTMFYNEKQIRMMSTSESAELRALIAKTLVYEENIDAAIAVLSNLVVDQDELVRIEAVDSLSAFSNIQSYSAMHTALTDSSELVRAYAAIGVAIVGKDVSPAHALKSLLHRKKIEHSKYVLTSVYESLYMLGEKEYLSQLLELFQENNYYTKRAVLVALGEILDSNNYKAIQAFVARIDTKEYPVLVTEELQKLEDGLRGHSTGD